MLELFDPVADHPLRAHGQPDGPQPGRRPVRQPRFLSRAAPPGRPRRTTTSNAASPNCRRQRARLRDPNRRALLATRAGRDVALASHDDRTEEEIAENAADGIRVSEFPVTDGSRARAAKRAGMQVIAGAPNIVRGGSHSGNVAVADLLRRGAVDAFASDYVPSSLIEAAFQCARDAASACPRRSR